jgi:hypothetical protein
MDLMTSKIEATRRYQNVREHLIQKDRSRLIATRAVENIPPIENTDVVYAAVSEVGNKIQREIYNGIMMEGCFVDLLIPSTNLDVDPTIYAMLDSFADRIALWQNETHSKLLLPKKIGLVKKVYDSYIVIIGDNLKRSEQEQSIVITPQYIPGASGVAWIQNWTVEPDPHTLDMPESSVITNSTMTGPELWHIASFIADIATQNPKTKAVDIF